MDRNCGKRTAWCYYEHVLGMSTGRVPPGNKKTWWWIDEMKDAIRKRPRRSVKHPEGGKRERDSYRQTQQFKQTFNKQPNRWCIYNGRGLQ